MRWIGKHARTNPGPQSIGGGHCLTMRKTKTGKGAAGRSRPPARRASSDRPSDRAVQDALDVGSRDAPVPPGPGASRFAGSAVAQFSDLLRRRWPIVATTVIIGLALCVTLGATLPRSYSAKALLLVGAPASQSDGGTRTPNQEADDVVIQTEMSTLSSRQHLAAAAAAIDASNPEIGDRLARIGWLSATWKRVLGETERRAGFQSSHPESASESSSIAANASHRRERQLNELERNLRIVQELRSRNISVRYTASTPEAAAFIANAMIDVHVDSHVAQSQRHLQRELDWAESALTHARTELDQANRAVAEFIGRNVVPDEGRTRSIEQQTLALRRQLSTAQAELDTVVGRVGHIRHLQSRAGDWDYLATKRDFPHLTQLALAARDPKPSAHLETEAIPARVDVTEVAPPSRERARLEFANAIEETERDLRDRALTATTRRDTVQKALSEIEASRVETARLATDMADLRKRALDAHAAWQARQASRSKLQERLSVFTPGLRMLSAAAPPLHPSSPHPLYFVPPALVASLILGCVLALAVDQTDRRVRSRSDVAAALAIPCIGALPRSASWGGRSLRRNKRTMSALRSLALTCLRRSEGLRAISVVSPSSVDDPEDLALALAGVTQSFGRRTLLLNLHREGWLSWAWGRTGGKSLSDAIAGRCEPAEVIRRSGSGGPDVLSGSIADLERLAGFANGRFGTFLDKLARSYDLLVFRPPPLDESVAAIWIAAEADVILFVVRSGTTDSRSAAGPLQQLRSSAGLAPHAPEILGVLDQAGNRSRA